MIQSDLNNTQSQDLMVPMNNLGPNALPLNERVSVIIPVKNGGHQLVALLNKIRSQKKVREIEVIVVDSGSTDSSVENAKKLGAKVITIDPEEFSHGATRDMAGKLSTGEYLVFTVQDVLPSSDYWLFKMVHMLKLNPSVSALSVKQVVRSGADLYSRLKSENVYKMLHFDEDLMYTLSATSDLFTLGRVKKRALSFLDNVCSCMPRKTFDEFGFQSLQNAEDIDFGVRLVQAGRTIGFLNTVSVYHWHDRGPSYFLRRFYLGPKADVNILKNKTIDLSQYRINSIHDILCRAESLYDAIRGSILRWKSQGSISFSGYAGAFVESIRDLESSGPGLSSDRLGNPDLKQILSEVAHVVGYKLGSGYNFSTNHLLLHFGKELESIGYFLANENIIVEENVDDFVNTLYKVAGGIIGDCFGQWVMGQEKLTRPSFIDELDYLLAKGVCYS